MLERAHRLVLVSIAAAGLVVSSAGALAAAPALAATTFNVYLAPASSGGSDTTHTGLSRSSPILTLDHAQAVIRAAKPSTDVVVNILQGDYTVGETDWSFYIPGHTISFMADGYVLGGGRPAAGDPVFTNASTNGAWWFKAGLPALTADTFSNGGTTGLRFYYLRVRDYTGGISFDGEDPPGSKSLPPGAIYPKRTLGINGNTVEGMSFEQIGDTFTPASTWWGFGAILLTNSSNNTFDNNTFDQVENTPARGADHIHVFYITHFSSSNSVTRNRITTVTSYAIKVRDRSNYNDIDSNTFNDVGGTGTGGPSAYRDEFCDKTPCAVANNEAWQCASYGNTFSNNTLGTVLGSTAKLPVWTLSPPGQTNAGTPGSGCSIPSGLVRVSGSGNS
jgi:hypothetical protein